MNAPTADRKGAVEVGQDPAFVQEALSASRVGTWRTEFAGDRTITDHTTAAFFGVDPQLAAQGMPLSHYADAIHPDDRSRFFGKIDEVRRRGGLFVTEYRTCPTPGRVIWLLARGHYQYDADIGGICGSGVAIDVTDSKFDGHVEDRAHFTRLHPSEPALQRIAQLVIETREAIDEMDDKPGALRTAVDALLHIVGSRLAKELKSTFN